MNIETDLRSALDQVAATRSPAPTAWEENVDRVRRDRRQRAAVLVTASIAAITGVGLTVLPPSGESIRDRVVQPGTTASPSIGYRLANPGAYIDVVGPVRLGSVEVEGKAYDVTIFLGRPWSPRHPHSDQMACIAVADENGVVGHLWADPCHGPTHSQPGSGNDFVMELPPLLDQGLPRQPCSYGPMGNFDAVLTSTRTSSVIATSSDGSAARLPLIAGTEAWPVRVFAGLPAPGHVFTAYELRDAAGAALTTIPLGTPADDCVPAPAGG